MRTSGRLGVLQNSRAWPCRPEEVGCRSLFLSANERRPIGNASVAASQLRCCESDSQLLQNCGKGSVSLESLLKEVSLESLLKESACPPLRCDEARGAA